MRAALADWKKRLGKLPVSNTGRSSNAAGGLRMVTVGLVRELTAEAARRAALGAGARLVGTFPIVCRRPDVEHIVALAPDILLLAGAPTAATVKSSCTTRPRLVAARSSARSCWRHRNRPDEAATLLAGKKSFAATTSCPNSTCSTSNRTQRDTSRVHRAHVHAKGIDRGRRRSSIRCCAHAGGVMGKARG